ncbi:MAG: ImmA/IrrE family metallo-endopeptidase [Treponema sp.]|nr:ImmA/IrrE family metallo-endopeptidase [Treponema sp.]
MIGKLLKPEDYDEIEETVVNLFEDLGYTEFPVDCFDVVSKLKIELRKYSEVSEEERDYLIANFEDAFTLKVDNVQFILSYNDNMPPERIKFTLWYEIGHIQLGHLDGCNKSQALMKEEANHFAVFAQAPMPFVIMQRPYDEFDIANRFNLSLECANNVYRHYLNVIQYESVERKILSSRLMDIMQFSIAS